MCRVFGFARRCHPKNLAHFASPYVGCLDVPRLSRKGKCAGFLGSQGAIRGDSKFVARIGKRGFRFPGLEGFKLRVQYNHYQEPREPPNRNCANRTAHEPQTVHKRFDSLQTVPKGTVTTLELAL